MIIFLIVDDYLLYCDVLRGVLLLLFLVLIFKEVGDFNIIVDIFNNEDIDLLLFDLYMLGSNDLFGLLYIWKFFFEFFVVVVFGIEDIIFILKIISVGVLGFILKIVSV